MIVAIAMVYRTGIGSLKLVQKIVEVEHSHETQKHVADMQADIKKTGMSYIEGVVTKFEKEVKKNGH